MAISTVVIDFNGAGIYNLKTLEASKVVSLLMLAVTNLNGVAFQVEDSDGLQLTGPIILSDLQQFVTNIGTVAIPLAKTASGKGLKLDIKSGGRLTGFAVIDIT